MQLLYFSHCPVSPSTWIQCLMGNKVTKELGQTICRRKLRTYETTPQSEGLTNISHHLDKECQGIKMARENSQHNLRIHIQNKIKKNFATISLRISQSVSSVAKSCPTLCPEDRIALFSSLVYHNCDTQLWYTFHKYLYSEIKIQPLRHNFCLKK